MASRIYPTLRKFGREVNNEDGQIEAVFTTQIENNQPLRFFIFWGLGTKHLPDSNDHFLLCHLREIDQDIRMIYPAGTVVTLLLADFHGRLNGFGHNLNYLRQIDICAQDFGFQTLWLSQLYSRYNVYLPRWNEPMDISQQAQQIFASKPEQYLRSASRRDHKLEKVTQGALAYLEMRLREQTILLNEFQNEILLVNASKKLAGPYLPKNFPILYLKVGPVWFIQKNSHELELKEAQ